MQDPLRIGILGCARIAKAALIEPGRAAAGLAVVAVASRDPARSRRFATEHRERVVAAEDFALLDTLVAAFDEPFADASALATYRVCELARESVTVALSGDGADEALAGYRRYRF